MSLYRRAFYWCLDRLYNEFAPFYDLVAAVVSQRHWHRWIDAAVPLLQPGLTLEIGCGTGYLQRTMALLRLPHVGVDRSPRALAVARRKVAVAGIPSRLVCGDALQLPVRSGCCTNVIATFPAPYIFEPATLTEVARVLHRHGQLLIVDGGTLWPRSGQTHSSNGRSDLRDRRPALLHAHGFNVTVHSLDVDDSTVAVIEARPGSTG